MAYLSARLIAIHTEALNKPIDTREQFITDQLADIMTKLMAGDGNPITRLTAPDQPAVCDQAALALPPNLAAPKPASISARRK
jgi:hypothetical protein